MVSYNLMQTNGRSKCIITNQTHPHVQCMIITYYYTKRQGQTLFIAVIIKPIIQLRHNQSNEL